MMSRGRKPGSVAQIEGLGATRGRLATRDLVQGNLARLLVTLSWPTTAEFLLFNTTGLAHAYWLGRVDGALAAVVMGTALRLVLISPMMGLSMGGMAVVARHVGAREQDQADRAVMQTLVLVVGLTLPLIVLGLLFGRTFLTWMGATGATLDEAATFFQIVCYGLLFMEVLPSMNGVIRGAGHPEFTLLNNVVSIAVLLVSEPLLVLGVGPIPALGVAGAAWASVLGAASGVAVQMWTLLRGSAGVRLHLRDIVPDPTMMRRVLRIALPTTAQRFSPNLANSLLLRLVASFGGGILASYSLLAQLLAFMMAPSMGIGSGAAALVGQNLGAGRPERSERAGWLGTAATLGVSLLVFGSLAMASRAVLGFFSTDAELVTVASGLTLFMVAWGSGQAVLSALSSVLTSAGDALAAMVINMGALWALLLPLGWLLAHPLGLGPSGIWVGMSVAYALGCVAAVLRFRRGRWKQVIV